MRMNDKQYFSVQDSKNMGEFVDKFKDVYGLDSTYRTYYKLLGNALKHADDGQISIGEKDGSLKLGALSKTLAENIDLFIPYALKGNDTDTLKSMANFFKDINGLRKKGSKIEEQITDLFNFEAYKQQGVDDPIGAILGAASVGSYGKSKEEQQPYLDLSEQIKAFSPLYKNTDIPDIFKTYQESPDFKTYPAIEEELSKQKSLSKNSAPQLPDPSAQQNIQSGLYTLAGAAVVGLLALGAKKLHAGHKEQKRRNTIRELIEKDKKPEKDDETHTTKKKSKKKNKNQRKDDASTAYRSTQLEEASQYQDGVPRVISTGVIDTTAQPKTPFPQSPALTALTTPTVPGSTFEPFSLNNQDPKDAEIANLKARIKKLESNEQSAKDRLKRSQEKEQYANLRAEKAERNADAANERAKRAEKREEEATTRAIKADEKATEQQRFANVSKGNQEALQANLELAEQRIESLERTIKSKDRRIQEQNKQLKQFPEAERNAYNAGHYQGSVDTHPAAYHAGFVDGSQSVIAQQQQTESINLDQIYINGLSDGSQIAVKDAENAVKHAHKKGKEEGYKDGFENGYSKGIITAMQKTWKEFIEEGKALWGDKEKELNDNKQREQEAKKNEAEKPETKVESEKKHASKVASGKISPASIASEQESRQKAA